MRSKRRIRWKRLMGLMWLFGGVGTASAPVLVAQSSSGKVLEVESNGDLYLSDGQKVRLMGVDLPSTHQCFGDERLAYMREMLLGKPVSYTVEKRDLLGKNLAYVNAGGDVAADLIYSGHGFALKSFPYSNSDRYENAQASAKRAERGLWKKCEVECADRGCSTQSTLFSCSR